MTSHENDVPTVEIIASVYNKRDIIGDFNYMIQHDIQNNIDDTLYIFNDNEESFLGRSCKQGKGNATIRKYNIFAMKLKTIKKPYSHGIPTGNFTNRGYDELGDHEIYIIDLCINNIKTIIKKYNIKKIYYSASGPNKGDTLIGQSLFKVDTKVRQYITQQIHSLTNVEVTYNH
jgi:hypothetical protein